MRKRFLSIVAVLCLLFSSTVQAADTNLVTPPIFWNLARRGRFRYRGTLNMS